MIRPTIGIPFPTSFDREYNDRSWPEYARAVESAGGQAVGIPLDSGDADLAVLAAQCDGFLLPGSGADVETSRYAQEREEHTADPDSARERVDWYLLQEAEEKQKPMLCICFGTQSLNVFRGGTLVQHLNPMPVNHSAGRAVGVAHSAIVVRDSVLGSILDKQEASPMDEFWRIPINSSHHQAVGIPGDGLRVTARSVEDAVVEAVEGPADGPFLLGLQWHPERTTELSPTSRAIFLRFLQEAQAFALKRGCE